MDKEKAIEIVRCYYPSSGKDLNEALEALIPELKENDDKTMLKRIVSIIDDYSEWHQVDNHDCVAWLENKFEQEPDAWSNKDQAMLESVLAACSTALELEGNSNANNELLKELTDWLNGFKNRVRCPDFVPISKQFEESKNVPGYCFLSDKQKELVDSLVNTLRNGTN